MNELPSITILLRQASEDTAARKALLEQVYGRLRAMARARMSLERDGHQMQATELVHEAYIKLRRRLDDGSWESRAQFFNAAAEAMRRILIDHARLRARQKRGSGAVHIPLNGLEIAEENPAGLLALDALVDELESKDKRMAQIVKLRFHVGLSVDETAHAIGVSRRTVVRDWKFARAWLLSELSER